MVLAGFAGTLGGQTMMDLSRQGKLGTGTVLPAECQVGQIFFITNAPAGANLSTCTAPNVWSAVGLSRGAAASRPTDCTTGQIWLATDTGQLSFCSATGNPGTWSLTLGGSEGPPGPTGPQGTAGAAGSNGTTVWNGTTLPSNTLGGNGDFYLINPTTAPCLYGPKVGGAWPGSCLTLVGPAGASGVTGPQGMTGPAGTNGNTLWNGVSAPASGQGSNGDFFLNVATSCFYGPKAAGAWPGTCTSLVGPQGTAGANGNTLLNGAVAPASGQGSNGDFFLNTATSCLYGPKAAGAWPGTCTSLVGPQGSQGTAGANGNTIWNGTATPASGLGSNGDFYLLNPATAPCLYGPKAGGAWPGSCFAMASTAGNPGDIQKNGGSGALAAAVAGTDYQQPPAVLSTSGTLPVCDLGAAGNVTRCEQTLSANATASFQHLRAGAKFSWAWTQAGSGGPYTVAYTGAINTCLISPTASAVTVQLFEVQGDGVTVLGVGCPTNETMAIWRGPTGSAPATPTSGLACWFDSTATNWLCKDVGANLYAAVKTTGSAASNQFLTYVDQSGVQHTAQVTFSNLSGQTTLAQLPAIANNTLLGNSSGGNSTPSALTAIPAATLPVTVVQTSQSNTYTAGTQDFSGAAHALPAPKGVAAARPAVCTVGEMYFATDAVAGQNWYFCTSPNTWVQQLNSGSGGNGGAGASLFSSISSATAAGTSPSTLIGAVTGSTILAANTFTAGQFWQIAGEGYYSTPSGYAGTLTINLNIAGSTRVTTGAITPMGNVTNGAWRVNCGITTRTTGSSGTQIANCIFDMTGSSASVLTPADGAMAATAAWIIDTTSAQALDLQAAWSSTAGSPSITGTNIAAWVPGAPVTSINSATGAVTITTATNNANHITVAGGGGTSPTLDLGTPAVTHTQCDIVGADNAVSYLANSDLGPQTRQYFFPVAATIVEITVSADAGNPSILINKNHGGTQTNLLSGTLATAAAGAPACARTAPAATCIDGTTSSGTVTVVTTSNANVIAAGDWIELTSGTAGGAARRMTVCWTVTVN